jgi:ribose 5-phosphate isomerase RpiB
MKIAVISETSAGDRNPDIISALDGRGHEIFNVGMKKGGTEPQLGYTETGFLTGLLLHTGRADFVVGGCGTGQGYLDSAMQYPGVFAGLVLDSLDAWLFTQINGGNCISLALNKGYGWAGDVNLKFIFDRIFSVERGAGYPEHRKEPQAALRNLLSEVSIATHKTWPDILVNLPNAVTSKALSYPGVADLLDIDNLADGKLKAALKSYSS